MKKVCLLLLLLLKRWRLQIACFVQQFKAKLYYRGQTKANLTFEKSESLKKVQINFLLIKY